MSRIQLKDAKDPSVCIPADVYTTADSAFHVE
jgi:hypothetical protein